MKSFLQKQVNEWCSTENPPKKKERSTWCSTGTQSIWGMFGLKQKDSWCGVPNQNPTKQLKEGVKEGIKSIVFGKK